MSISCRICAPLLPLYLILPCAAGEGVVVGCMGFTSLVVCMAFNSSRAGSRLCVANGQTVSGSPKEPDHRFFEREGNGTNAGAGRERKRVSSAPGLPYGDDKSNAYNSSRGRF